MGEPTQHVPHIPTARPGCWKDTAPPRPWLWSDRHQMRWRKLKQPNEACHFATWPEEERRKLQGKTCDGCARLEVAP